MKVDTYIRAFSNDLGPNQACTLFGSTPGNPIVQGSSYIEVGYQYNVADLWRRNLLVVLGFVILFQLTQIIILEYFPVSSSQTPFVRILIYGVTAIHWSLFCHYLCERERGDQRGEPGSSRAQAEQDDPREGAVLIR